MDNKKLDKKWKFYNKRIERLWGRQQKVEALVFMSLFVEFFVREAIVNFEKIIEGAAVSSHVNFNPRRLYSRRDIEEKPLGDLVRILETYTSDKDLIEDLNEFSKTRNKCVHRLLKYEISDINFELKGFNVFYYDLMAKLIGLSVAQLELANKHFDHICGDCFREVIAKEIKL